MNNILKKTRLLGGNDLPSKADLNDTKDLNNKEIYKPGNNSVVNDTLTNFALPNSQLGGYNKIYSEKEENNLKNLFYNLINKSYLNYLHHTDTQNGGRLFHSYNNSDTTNNSVSTTSYIGPDMKTDSYNTTGLNNGVTFNIDPVNNNRHPDFSNFAKDH